MSLEVQMARAAAAQAADVAGRIGRVDVESVVPPKARMDNAAAAGSRFRKEFDQTPKKLSLDEPVQVAQVGKNIYMPSAKSLPRRNHEYRFGISAQSPNSEANIKQLIEHVNAVPSGARELNALAALAQTDHQTAFIGTDSSKFETHQFAKVEMSSGEPFVLVNSTVVDKALRGDPSANTTPAKVVRGFAAATFEAGQRWARALGLVPMSFKGVKTDQIAATIKADNLYGASAGKSERGTFDFQMTRQLHREKLVNAFEEVTPEWSTFIDASAQSGSTRLALELVKTSEKGKTPLGAVLRVFDTRINWAPLENFNDLLHRFPELTLEKNSLVVLDALRNAQAADALREMANEHKQRNTVYPKISGDDLMYAAAAEVRDLVASGKYSLADVEGLIEGLSLPTQLHTFFERLLGKKLPSPISSQQPQQNGPVAKLQLTTP